MLSTSSGTWVGCPFEVTSAVSGETAVEISGTSEKVHVEACVGSTRSSVVRAEMVESEVEECTMSVSRLSVLSWISSAPGRGYPFTVALGWTQLACPARSGCVDSPACTLHRVIPEGSGFCWRLGVAFHLPHSVGVSCCRVWLLVCVRARRCRASLWGAVWSLPAGVWRAVASRLPPWCADGEVPTAANLNLCEVGVARSLAQRQRRFLWGSWGSEAHGLFESWVSCGPAEVPMMVRLVGGWFDCRAWARSWSLVVTE